VLVLLLQVMMLKLMLAHGRGDSCRLWIFTERLFGQALIRMHDASCLVRQTALRGHHLVGVLRWQKLLLLLLRMLTWMLMRDDIVLY
jgi:hypothetical protein